MAFGQGIIVSTEMRTEWAQKNFRMERIGGERDGKLVLLDLRFPICDLRNGGPTRLIVLGLVEAKKDMAREDRG